MVDTLKKNESENNIILQNRTQGSVVWLLPERMIYRKNETTLLLKKTKKQRAMSIRRRYNNGFDDKKKAH